MRHIQNIGTAPWNRSRPSTAFDHRETDNTPCRNPQISSLIFHPGRDCRQLPLRVVILPVLAHTNSIVEWFVCAILHLKVVEFVLKMHGGEDMGLSDVFENSGTDIGGIVARRESRVLQQVRNNSWSYHFPCGSKKHSGHDLRTCTRGAAVRRKKQHSACHRSTLTFK